MLCKIPTIMQDSFRSLSQPLYKMEAYQKKPNIKGVKNYETLILKRVKNIIIRILKIVSVTCFTLNTRK